MPTIPAPMTMIFIAGEYRWRPAAIETKKTHSDGEWESCAAGRKRAALSRLARRGGTDRRRSRLLVLAQHLHEPCPEQVHPLDLGMALGIDEIIGFLADAIF